MRDLLVAALRESMKLVSLYEERGRAYVLKNRNVELTQWDERILRMLDAHPSKGLSSRELYETLSQAESVSQTLHSSTISQVVSRLEKKRLVKAERSGAKRKEGKKSPEITKPRGTIRNPFITLSEQGRELMVALSEAESLPLSLLVDFMGLKQDLQFQLVETIQKAMFLLRTGKASSAEMYDYFLGGINHSVFARDVAHQFGDLLPLIRTAAIENRAFLRRAVRYLAEEEGVAQYVDIGPGYPTGGTHDVLRTINSEAKVLYIDNDADVVSKSQQMIDNPQNVKAIRADLLDIDVLLLELNRANLFDLKKPIAIILVAIVHLIKDDGKAKEIIRSLSKRLAPGSFIVLSHAVKEDSIPSQEFVDRFTTVYEAYVTSGQFRTHDEIEGLLKGTDLIQPGLVYTAQWRRNIEDRFLPRGYKPLSEFEGFKSMCLAAVGKIRK